MRKNKNFRDPDTIENSDKSLSMSILPYGSLAGKMQTPPPKTVVNLTTPQRFTFDPPIKGMEINVRYAAGSTGIDPGDGILFVASNHPTSVTDNWLDEANIAPRRVLLASTANKEQSFDGDNIAYVDIIGIGDPATNNLIVSIGGVS